MGKRTSGIGAVVLWCLACAAVSCDLQEPERYVRPPVIKAFSPKSPFLSAALGDTLLFSITAEDPQGQRLTYRFLLDDSTTSEEPRWVYVVGDTGAVDVRGCASNGFSESEIQWRLIRFKPVNLPPRIVRAFPPQEDVSLIVGASQEFEIEAVDPEGKPLSYAYAIGDEIVSVNRLYTFQSSSVGLVLVRAIVSDGETFTSHSWAVHVAAEPDSIAPAKVAVLSIGPGPEAG